MTSPRWHRFYVTNMIWAQTGYEFMKLKSIAKKTTQLYTSVHERDGQIYCLPFDSGALFPESHELRSASLSVNLTQPFLRKTYSIWFVLVCHDHTVTFQGLKKALATHHSHWLQMKTQMDHLAPSFPVSVLSANGQWGHSISKNCEGDSTESETRESSI